MGESFIDIGFEPSGRTVSVLPGSCLLEAAARAGLTIDTPCGGGATCGKCRVRFTAAAPPPNESDVDLLSPEEQEAGWRLACRCHPQASCRAEIPVGSLFGGPHQILHSSAASSPQLDCGVRKVYVQLPRPGLRDTAADVERLLRETGPCRVPLGLLRSLHENLDREAYCGTAVIADGTLLDLEPGDTTGSCFGVAIDIGTTTLVASLHDLADGAELAVASRLNSQVRFGDDVLSRIGHAARSPDGLARLRQAVLGDCAAMIDQLSESAGVPSRRIYSIAVAGNTTMQHLAAGIDPAPLGEVPFIPVQSAGMRLAAADFDLPVHPAARIELLPVIGGFVGGDTVAGLIATQIDEQPGRTLLVDIGTNGEIVLAIDGKLWATSAAAGPAFEGARISCGMRAAEGAIEKVAVHEGHLVSSTIGGGPARGICGSGLIDAAAELLRFGVISPLGRLASMDELPPDVPSDLKRRIETDGEGRNLVWLTGGGAERGQGPVRITQRDVRELQLASGAIRAATNVLLRQAGLTAADLDAILLAGGFGSFIRRSNAQWLGLLPPAVDHDRIRFVGNVSLRGAQWVLLSKSASERAQRLARQAELVELSTDPEFQQEFAEAMVFPSAS